MNYSKISAEGYEVEYSKDDDIWTLFKINGEGRDSLGVISTWKSESRPVYYATHSRYPCFRVADTVFTTTQGEYTAHNVIFCPPDPKSAQ